MEIQENQEERMKRNKNFEGLKNFFIRDIQIKELLLKLAPTSLDDWNEESRIQYIDKLAKNLKYMENEFLYMVQNFDFGPEVSESIQSFFSKAKESFLIGKYEKGVSLEIYQKQFSNMHLKLLEEVKNKCVGYIMTSPHDLAKLIGQAKTINELLHVIHSYIVNNNEILQAMPIIDKKENTIGESITFYGEENEISKKIFDDFPLELDCGITDILSLPNQVLMMIRDRAHAMTIDIDIHEKDDILVRYFVPKLCNINRIRKLPGIDTQTISVNGAMGRFRVSPEELTSQLFDFIDRVPTDADIPRNVGDPFIKDLIKEENDIDDKEKKNEETNFLFCVEDARNLAMQAGKEGRRMSKIKKLQQKIKQAIREFKDKPMKKIKGDSDDRTGRDE